MTIILSSFVALVSAWQIISGYAGYIFPNSAASYGFGMHVNVLFIQNLGFFGVIPLAAAICTGRALVIGIPFLRITEPYFVIATRALSELIRNVFIFHEIRFTLTLGRVGTIRTL